MLPTPFLDIQDRVRSGGELGLLGLAFHPRYPANGRFFLNYTRNGPEGLETVIAEYAVSSANPNLANRNSERILLRFAQPFTNHNGGMLAFGQDGFLYIGTGDGGSAGDPMRNGQNVETLLGKILRMDVDSGEPYASPPDNPFVGRAGRDEIWAYGLRNPWRFSFDRLTGRLIAGDVGQNRREEIDIIVKGGNYGWNIMEGMLCFLPSTNCNQTGLILPIHDYGRDLGTSVTGGYVYRGKSAPSLTGKYLFGDFGSGRLWALTETTGGQWEAEQLLTAGNISSFGEDEAGEVYVVDYGGSVRQIIESGDPQPAVNRGGIVNAASFLPDAVAPGKIATIFGAGIGPNQGVGAQLDSSGRVSTSTAEAQVFFDGIPAPLYFVRADQVNAQVPYAIAGRTSTQLQVQYRGALTSPVTLLVAEAAPGIFAQSGGSGQGAILNQDTTPNSSANPAPRGSVVVVYATGEGQTTPAGSDGRLAEVPFPLPLLPVSLEIGGLAADVLFAGSAPGFAGLLQVNARIPPGVTPGAAVPVLLRVGGASSQPGVTVAVN
ncbi:MAG: hypothetical protein A3H28_01320 [Acidobacteria bacterium RIFCSPLOWO2_02_FULL_61_28]|nr:MAG: hypothetical protein A3H28_01320 [Acidobacteria bacterium RIFCSPLOWO2_02_FULL_61_28]